MTRRVRISRLLGRDGIERSVTFTVRDGVICSRTADVPSGELRDETIEIDGIGLPLFVNAHTHLELTGLGGTGGGNSLWDWILSVIRTKRSRSDDDFRAAIAEGEAALIASCTGVAGDIRSVLPGGPFPESMLDFRTYGEVLGYDDNLFSSKMSALDAFLASGAAHKGLAVHSLYTTPFSKAKDLIAHARRKGLPVMMHCAETAWEGKLFFANELDGFNRLFPGAQFEQRGFRSYADIIEYLDLGPDTLLVHCTHFTAADWDRARERNIPVVLCPRSNRFWGDDLPDFDRVMHSGMRWALGTDSTLTNADLDVLSDARFIYRHARGANRGMEILRALTYGGRDVLGIAGDGLTVGQPLAFAWFPGVPESDAHIPGYILGGELKPCICRVAGRGGMLS